MAIETSRHSTLVRETLASRSRELLLFLKSLVGSPADAEDLLQSGSLRALEKSGELQDAAKVYPWLLSVFRNLALDLLRTRKSEARRSQDLEPAEFDNLPAPASETPESRESPTEAGVCACGLQLMKNIPKSYSTLLQKVELDGASIQQMARALATTPNNVSVRLHRARHSLKVAVQEHCEVETLAQCLNCDCGKDQN